MPLPARLQPVHHIVGDVGYEHRVPKPVFRVTDDPQIPVGHFNEQPDFFIFFDLFEGNHFPHWVKLQKKKPDGKQTPHPIPSPFNGKENETSEAVFEGHDAPCPY